MFGTERLGKCILAIVAGLAAAVTVSVTAAPAHADGPVFGEGSRVGVQFAGGTICTLGPVGVGSDGLYRGFFARHCTDGADEGAPVLAVNGVEFGKRIGVIDKVAEVGSDVAMVKFDRSVDVSMEVLGPGNKNYPLAGALSPTEAYALAPTLCGTGIVSGFRCGSLRPYTDGRNGTVAALISGTFGDSGSGLFAFADGKAYAVGVLRQAQDGHAFYQGVDGLAKSWGVSFHSARLN